MRLLRQLNSFMFLDVITNFSKNSKNLMNSTSSSNTADYYSLSLLSFSLLTSCEEYTGRRWITTEFSTDAACMRLSEIKLTASYVNSTLQKVLNDVSNSRCMLLASTKSSMSESSFPTCMENPAGSLITTLDSSRRILNFYPKTCTYAEYFWHNIEWTSSTEVL